MEFHKTINAKLTGEQDRPIMQKETFAVSNGLQLYLKKYGRDVLLPLRYIDLLYYSHANSLRDHKGKLTHWETVVYDIDAKKTLEPLLLGTYAMLKNQNSMDEEEDLEIVRIDFCEFGNSIPFRIKVINRQNGLSDEFYIKTADASRIYGLELEQLLSPNQINFLYHDNTLVEEHIPGIAGDVFSKQLCALPEPDKLLLAKEFVQFNERCFIRLLGDMRSYNFAVVTDNHDQYPDYRIRAIDFDQQCYEGKKNLYLPQFYGENWGFVENVSKQLDPFAIKQYQTAERAEMAGRMRLNGDKLSALLNCMQQDELSENYKVLQLRRELSEHFSTDYFADCTGMGSILKRHLKYSLQEVNLLNAEP